MIRSMALSKKKSPPNPPETLALDALKTLAINSDVIAKMIKPLVMSSNRHGDLQVIRSAATHLIEAADILIAEEQR